MMRCGWEQLGTVGVVGAGEADGSAIVSLCNTSEKAIVCYVPATTRIPSLSTDKVSITGPGNAVFASSAVGISDVGPTVCPEGVVVSITGSGRAGGVRLSLREIGSRAESSSSEGEERDQGSNR